MKLVPEENHCLLRFIQNVPVLKIQVVSKQYFIGIAYQEYN